MTKPQSGWVKKVSVPEPSLRNNTADAERLIAALKPELKSETVSIDLDLLLFGDRDINTETLIVPHPKLLKRAFVLIPLLQIDPEAVHPASGKSLADFVTTGGRSTVKLYKDHVAREV